MTEEHRQIVQEYRKAVANLNEESEKYIANISEETMALPDFFKYAIQREQEALKKLKDLPGV